MNGTIKLDTTAEGDQMQVILGWKNAAGHNNLGNSLAFGSGKSK